MEITRKFNTPVRVVRSSACYTFCVVCAHITIHIRTIAPKSQETYRCSACGAEKNYSFK